MDFIKEVENIFLNSFKLLPYWYLLLLFLARQGDALFNSMQIFRKNKIIALISVIKWEAIRCQAFLFYTLLQLSFYSYFAQEEIISISKIGVNSFKQKMLSITLEIVILILISIPTSFSSLDLFIQEISGISISKIKEFFSFLVSL